MLSYTNFKAKELASYLRSSNENFIVLPLVDTRRRVVITSPDGEEYTGDWYVVDTNVSECDKAQFRLLVKEHDLHLAEFGCRIETEQVEKTIYISIHAMERAKKRLGWNKKTLTRMTKKVLLEGSDCDSLSNDVRNILAEQLTHHKGKKKMSTHLDDIIVYGHNAYVFKRSTLVTVIPIGLLDYDKEWRAKDRQSIDKILHHKTDMKKEKRRQFYTQDLREINRRARNRKNKTKRGQLA